MPFILIEGTFHLTNRTAKGTATGFEPDGDSIQFKPKNAKLLDQLTRLQLPYRLTAIGSTQLRIEGIDALELHYKPTHGGPYSHQPRPLADEARDFLTGFLGLNPVPYAPPKNVRVKPPVPKDGTPGFILSRSLEVHGRPVAFVFAGQSPAPDGTLIDLSVPVVKKSYNYQATLKGYAYPLFYDTLFGDLREALAGAAGTARSKKRGIWNLDRSTKGFGVTDQLGLETDGVIFPKLYRRLTDFLAETPGDLAGFEAWLKAKNEQVLDLERMNFTHLDNLVSVKGKTVKITRTPEHLVFVSEK
jgi:endonuclease YncB( thermonuclease family)